MHRVARTLMTLVGTVMLVGCATSPSTSPEGSPERTPPLVEPPALTSPPPSPGAGGTPTPTAPVEAPLTLPPGPATAAPPPAPPPPGSLPTVDWSAFSHPAACDGARSGAPVFADLDGDGAQEAAVPVTCAGASAATSVRVYGGDAVAPRDLGEALPPEEQGELHSMQVRDRHLVVTAVTTRSTPRDTAVTSRWVLAHGELTRTDRWEDPAFVLEVDADE